MNIRVLPEVVNGCLFLFGDVRLGCLGGGKNLCDLKVCKGVFMCVYVGVCVQICTAEPQDNRNQRQRIEYIQIY